MHFLVSANILSLSVKKVCNFVHKLYYDEDGKFYNKSLLLSGHSSIIGNSDRQTYKVFLTAKNKMNHFDTKRNYTYILNQLLTTRS